MFQTRLAMVGPLFKYTKLFDGIFLVHTLDTCKVLFSSVKNKNHRLSSKRDHN